MRAIMTFFCTFAGKKWEREMDKGQIPRPLKK